MIEILFLVLCAFGAFHFVLEAIIAPSIRYELRFRIFALRDRTRELKLKHGDNISDEVFDFMQDSLNNSLNMLSKVSLHLVYSALEAFTSDEELRARVEQRLDMLKKCKVGEVWNIVDENSHIMFSALKWNSASWAIYIIPILLVWKSASTIMWTIRSNFSLF